VEGGKPRVSSSAVRRGFFFLGEGVLAKPQLMLSNVYLLFWFLNVDERVGWNG